MRTSRGSDGRLGRQESMTSCVTTEVTRFHHPQGDLPHSSTIEISMTRDKVYSRPSDNLFGLYSTIAFTASSSWWNGRVGANDKTVMRGQKLLEVWEYVEELCS